MKNSNGLKEYLANIAQYALLTPEEEKELAICARNGDKVARKQLINANLRLVVSCAMKYNGIANIGLMDLIGEGNAGLIKAIDGFDPSQGYRLSTYAVPWIKQAITKAMTDSGRTIRLPAHIYQLQKRYKNYLDSVTDGRVVSNEEAAAALGVTADKIENLKQWVQAAISLDTPLGDDSEETIGDLQADTHVETPVERYNRIERNELLRKALHRLDERACRIMKLRYGIAEDGDGAEYQDEHTLEQIGVLLGITRERVRQIEKESLLKLKTILGR